MEKKLLIVVDMQNDFIDGALGSAEAVAIVPHVYDKIVNWEGDMIVTRDTHKEDYMLLLFLPRLFYSHSKSCILPKA